MKKMLLTLVLALGFMSSAQAADELNVILECQPAVLRPDLGMTLTLTTGGIVGSPMIQIQRFFLGHSTTENYIVRRKSILTYLPLKVGAPVTYAGEGIRLDVNFTTAPDQNGAHRGILQLQNEDGTLNQETLSCKVPKLTSN
jgi:opacity protein-like surface antigen